MTAEWTIGSEEWKDHVQAGAESLGMAIQRSAVDCFSRHALELMRWNSKINLTAITDPLDVAVKHYIDSIAAADLIPRNARILDIGSGAGFPAIPLKIIFPTLAATLTDAVRKKVSFLNHAGRTLELKNFRAIHIRIDKKNGIRKFQSELRKYVSESNRDDPLLGSAREGHFDVVIARALTSLDDFLSMALPLLARKGRILAWKGRLAESEIDSAERTVDSLLMKKNRGIGSPRSILKRYKLPFLGDERSIVGIRFE